MYPHIYVIFFEFLVLKFNVTVNIIKIIVPAIIYKIHNNKWRITPLSIYHWNHSSIRLYARHKNNIHIMIRISKMRKFYSNGCPKMIWELSLVPNQKNNWINSIFECQFMLYIYRYNLIDKRIATENVIIILILIIIIIVINYY